MSGEKPSKQKLPPNTDDKVIEVSLKQVIWGFSLLMVCTAATAGTIIVLKDYSKYKRQEAVINSVIKLIDLVRLDQKGVHDWKQQKKDSSSPTVTSSEAQESPGTSD